MIRLSNGHKLQYVVASGALAFDGKGWPWERPLVWCGLIKPELFTVFIKSLTLEPRKGNLRWWKPWECISIIKGGSVNKVGLTNKGIKWWCKKVAPKINFKKYAIAGSIFGKEEELVAMAKILNEYPFKAIEVNPSCPNSGGPMPTVEETIAAVKAVCNVSHHPIIIKVSVVHDYLAIAEGLKGIAEAISLNSVPWERVFSKDTKKPLRKLEKKVGGGAGGVSGKPAQKSNWKAVKELIAQGALPVIAPSIMNHHDAVTLKSMGAPALSYGAIHLLTPWRPTRIVEKELKYDNR